MKQLRPYQQAAIDATLAKLEECDSTVVVLPTGCGKTVYASRLIANWNRGNTLFMAHTRELITQAADKLSSELGYRPPIEMNVSSVDIDQIYGGDMCIVGSVQTMSSSKRLNKYRKHPFGLIVIDEAHHCTSSTYRRVLDFFRDLNPSLKIVGITATPNRTDGAAIGTVFQSDAYQMTISDAIEEGWLVPVEQEYIVCDNVNYDAIKTKKNEFGESDFNAASLEDVMVEEENLQAVAGALIKKAGQKSTLVFCTGVTHAHMLASILNRHRDGSAQAIDGTTDKNKRSEVISDFSKGKLQFLTNCQVLTEGFDAPNCELIAMARPTKSLSLYCLSDDTEILTDNGWVGEKDFYRIGNDESKAAGYDLATGKIAWTPILGKYRRPLNDGERMFELESSQVSLRVTESHRLLWRTPGSKSPFQLIEARELSKRRSEYEIPVSAIQDAPGVPLSNADLEFIGWLMTDGNVNKITGQVSIHQASHQPWIWKLEQTIQACGFKYTRSERVRKTQFSDHANTVMFTISRGNPRGRDKHLTGWGRLEPYFDKNLSPLLEDVTAEQLAVLLEAMHLGDGTKFDNQTWTRRSYHIASGRKLLVDRLQSLCVRRGFRCHIGERNYNKNPLWIIHIKHSSYRHVGGALYSDRPILRESKTTPGETVWCVTTGTSTIVTRRKGKVVLMGQTQMLGRGLRPLPGVVDGVPEAFDRRMAIMTSDKPTCHVLDFVGNSNHKLAGAFDVLGGNYDVEVRELAAEEAKQNKQPVTELLEQAKILRQLELQWNARKHVIADVNYQSYEVDPFGHGAAPGVQKASKGRGGCSDAQIGLLVNLGVTYATAASYSKKQAGAVIDSLGKTRCTAKQAKALERAGINPNGIGLERASKILDALAKNNWKPLRELPE